LSTDTFSESEAQQLVGTRFRSIAKKSIVPRGSHGRAVAIRKNPSGGYNIVVHWEVNRAFIMPVPIQAEYSKVEASSQLEPV
jgi:hypothetical protein